MRDSANAKLDATVLLPTPPLPLITRMTCLTPGTGSSGPISRAAVGFSLMTPGGVEPNLHSVKCGMLDDCGANARGRSNCAREPGDDHAETKANTGGD